MKVSVCTGDKSLIFFVCELDILYGNRIKVTFMCDFLIVITFLVNCGRILNVYSCFKYFKVGKLYLFKLNKKFK